MDECRRAADRGAVDIHREPYEEMGGNGSAKRVMEEVRKLPIQ